MMTQHSARAPVALQLQGSSPVGHQLHQNIVYIENFQFIYAVNKLFSFRTKIFAERTICWQVTYGSTAVFVVLRYHGSTVVPPNTSLRHLYVSRSQWRHRGRQGGRCPPNKTVPPRVPPPSQLDRCIENSQAQLVKMERSLLASWTTALELYRIGGRHPRSRAQPGGT